MITEIFLYLKDLNTGSVCFRLCLTVILGGIVGIERERHGKAAGLRTHILVCLGAAMAVMTGMYISDLYGEKTDASRIAAQVVSGIGFLGAGTILVRNKSTITGLTTAASVWATGTLGLAIGSGLYEAAILCTVFMLFTAGKLGDIDRILMSRSRETALYVEFKDVGSINGTIEEIKAAGFHVASINLAPPKSGLSGGIGADMVIKAQKPLPSRDIVQRICAVENVYFAIEV